MTLFFLSNFIKSQITYNKIEVTRESIDGKDVFKIGDLMILITGNTDYDFINLYEKRSSDKDYIVFDTVYFSPYSSAIYAFNSPQFPDYVILWVTENEYDSDIHVFYFSSDKLSKVGILPILVLTPYNLDNIIKRI